MVLLSPMQWLHTGTPRRLTLYTPQQVPHYLHRALADVLEVPMHQINVYRTFVGGGFGGKSDPFPHEMCAAILARKTGRPVRINFDRRRFSGSIEDVIHQKFPCPSMRILTADCVA